MEEKRYLKLDLKSSVIERDDVLDSLTVTFSMILSVEANQKVAKEALEYMPTDYLTGLVSGLKIWKELTETVMNERKENTNEESKSDK